MKIITEDFSDPYFHYSFDIESPASVWPERKATEKNVGSRGFGSWEKLGSVFSKRKFVAVFLYKDQIFISINGQMFSFLSPHLRVELTKKNLFGGGIVRVIQDAKVVFQDRYWFANTDPEGFGGGYI